jgi:uncharacterized SAM-binding protein YcdF (DUF218 family)
MKTMKRRLLALFVLLILAAAIVGFRGTGRWLTREDPLSRSDVIFVLSGGLPYRAEEGGRVFGMGYAPEVWLSRPYSPSAKLEKLGIHFVGEEEYSREVLLREGVPESAIHIMPDTVIDTEQEVVEAARQMHQDGKTTVIIVTSPEHTRRVRALWSRLAGNNLHLIVHAAHEDPFDVDHWWRNTRDVYSVMRETLGLVNAWAGLPVRPQTN